MRLYSGATWNRYPETPEPSSSKRLGHLVRRADELPTAALERDSFRWPGRAKPAMSTLFLCDAKAIMILI